MNEKIRRLLRTELIQPKTALAAAFIVPTASYLIMFVMRDISPFGDRTMFGMDLYHQYGPFLSELRHKLINGESLFYTWNLGLGMNFWSLFAYYLASPWNLLLTLVGQKYLVEAITFLIVLKIGLSSLSMTWYLRSHCKSYDFGVALFGILYAMSGYVTAYHWNLMWMDCVLLFPLVLWGAERLADGKGGLWYCLLLGLSIWSNYYISIMTCLFLVLYFPAFLVVRRQDRKTIFWNLVRFAGYSLLAGGLCAVLLIPAWRTLQMSYAGTLQLPKLSERYFSVFPVLARHLANVKAEYEQNHWPNIYCGVAVLLLVPLYFLDRKNSRRERLVYGGLAAFLLISFCVPMLDYLWHGLHFPNCFPARQSYLYCFLLLVMSYKAYLGLPQTGRKRMAFLCAAALIFVFLAWKFPAEKEYFQARSYWLSAGYLLVYTGCMMCARKRNIFRHQVMVLAFGLMWVETVFTVTDNGMFDNSRTRYTENEEAVGQLVGELEKEHVFFRMKTSPQDKVNDGAWLHYPAMNSFSSTNYYSVYQVMHWLGCEAHPNYYGNNGATPLVDMMFGISWDYSREEKPQTGWRKMESGGLDGFIYRNPLAFPVGFLTGAELETLPGMKEENPAEFQNQIAECFGADPVLIFAGEGKPEKHKVRFLVLETGEYYVLAEAERMNMLYTEICGKKRKLETWTPGCMEALGFCRRGEEIVFSSGAEDEALHVKLYRFDGNGLERIREGLVKIPWNQRIRTDTTLAGTITCPEAGVMMTTIPYDPGWHVWVDRKRQEVRLSFGAFLGISLEAGEHEIRMRYVPKGFLTGAAVSAASLIVLLILTAKIRIVEICKIIKSK